ncbi:MAG: hypothetical protein JWO87_1394 [Phycisphaerales bacterium]|jgi:hypothetical protein|nr:hypothetical protein [Phycisphaerales bacterium]MDB5299731.1 hypothetical protein [Phycisphaerales bacterium]
MSKKPHRPSGKSREEKRQEIGNESNVEQNPGVPWDYAKVGPRSIEGVAPADLPDKGRGSIETDPGKELARKLPQQTGAIEEGTDVGLRGEPDIADAAEHGGGGAT